MSVQDFDLISFNRSDIDYSLSEDGQVKQAYFSGVYDALVSSIGKELCNKTGECDNQADLLRVMFNNFSFKGDLAFTSESGEQVQTEDQQRQCLNRWFTGNPNLNVCTHMFLATPGDNDSQELARVVTTFLKTHFSGTPYLHVEHTDTNTLHHHAVVACGISDADMAKLQSAYFRSCMQSSLVN